MLTLSRSHLPTIMVSTLDIYLPFERSLEITSLAEITGIAAADIVHDFLSMFMAKEPPNQSSHRKPKNHRLDTSKLAPLKFED